MSRIARVGALLVVAVLLVLPASAATAGDGPVATKSGAIVNYVSTGKLKVAKNIEILVVCSVACNVTSNTVIKGPGVHLTGTVSGALQANVPGGPFFKPNKPLLKALKADTGRFKLVSRISATDPATGAVDNISHSFKFKK